METVEIPDDDDDKNSSAKAKDDKNTTTRGDDDKRMEGRPVLPTDVTQQISILDSDIANYVLAEMVNYNLHNLDIVTEQKSEEKAQENGQKVITQQDIL